MKLTDSTSSTSTTTAATPKSVKSAYDLADTAKTNAATAQQTADSKVGSVSLASGTNNGTLKLTVDGTSTDNIAVKGLGSAAYTEAASYATSNHAHDAATTSVAGFMTAAMVTKLNGIATGANKTTVDTALSSSSTNPVQNKVVNSAIATATQAITANTNSITAHSEAIGNLQTAVNNIQEITSEEIAVLFA